MRTVGRQRRGYDSVYIVHDERMFIYFVLQKAACTSVKTALLPLFDLNTTVSREVDPGGEHIGGVHKQFNGSNCQIDKREMLEGLDEEFCGYFKFAFVRNPWDRLLSCYLDKIVRLEAEPLKGFKSADVEFYPGMPFAEFVEAVYRIPDDKANAHFRSQHITVCDLMDQPMTDFLGHFENLEDDFALVAREIGEPDLELPKYNRARSKGSNPHRYRDYYDDRLRNLTYSRFEKDIETFRYLF